MAVLLNSPTPANVTIVVMKNEMKTSVFRPKQRFDFTIFPSCFV
jgi:hypothetical protein